MILNFTTVALFFPAVHEIGIAHVSLAGQAATLVLVILITLLPASAPPVAVMLLGERAQPAMNALNTLFTKHQRKLTIVICFGFAILLIALSLKHLL